MALPEHHSVLPRGHRLLPHGLAFRRRCRDAFSQSAEHPALPRFSPSLQHSEAKPTQPCCFHSMPPVPHPPPRESSNPLRKLLQQSHVYPRSGCFLLSCLPPGEGTVWFPRFWDSKAESEGQELQDSTCTQLTLVGEGSCWAQSTARASPQLPQDPFQAHSRCCHLTRLLAAPRDRWGSRGLSPALGSPVMFRIPVQSSILTWLRGSHSCSRFLRSDFC